MSTRSPLARLADRLASPRLAAVLIAAFMGLTVLNVLVPQRLLLSEDGWRAYEASQPVLATLIRALGLDSIFTGWIIVVLGAALLASLGVCTGRRLARAVRPVALKLPTAAAGRPDYVIDAARAADALAAAGAALVRDGWDIAASGPGGLVAVRGRHGIWGSMLLHAALAVLIVAGSFAYFTGFTGNLIIAEGQQVADVASSYLAPPREPRIGRAYTGALVTLEDMRVRYEDGVVVEAVAELSAIGRSGSISHSVQVNRPLDVDGRSYLLQENGYSVALVLTGAEGGAQRVQVNLAERVPEGWRDTIELSSADGPVSLVMTGMPRPSATGDAVEALRLDDPRLVVAATGADGSLTEATLAPGGTIEVPGYGTVGFEEMRLWARFFVRGQPERVWVYLALWASLAGALWRFVSPERRVAIAVAVSAASAEVRIRWRVRPWSPFAGWEGRDTGPARSALAEYAVIDNGEVGP